MRPPARSHRIIVQRWVAPLVVLGGLVLLWQAAVRLTGAPQWLLPAPTDVGAALINDRDLLLANALVTLQEVLIGFAVAVVAGVGCGIAITRSPVLDRALYPLIIASQTVPVPAIAPLLLVWFGYGLLPKVLVTALVGFFPLVVSTVEGVRSTDREVVNLLRAFGAPPGRVFRLAEFPSAMPAIFAGARIAVAICVIGAVFGELVGAKAGLGYLLTRSIAQFETPRMVAAIFLLAVMGSTLFALVGLVEKLLLPWRRLVTVQA
ncbi:MAG: ABC transporter permease [Thermomicrobiales bacterium]|nr:ABC transporter permease [Thermomicrobiales bacterium]